MSIAAADRFLALSRRLVDTDRTCLYMARRENLVDHDYPASITAHWMTPDEVRDLTTMADSDVSLHSVREVADTPAMCSGVFVDGQPAGYVFVVPHDMAPAQNSGGSHFHGIGARLPPGVLYMYKLYTLPEYRGRKLIALAIRHGAFQYGDGQAHTAFTTTAAGNPAAIRALEKMGMTNRCKLREQVLLGQLHHYDFPATLPVADPQDPGDARPGHLRFYTL